MKKNREHELLRELDKLAFVASSLAILIFAAVYCFVTTTSSIPPMIREFVSGITLNLIPIFLILAVSYALFRRIQEIKSKRETEDLAREIADKMHEQKYGPTSIGLKGRGEFAETLDAFIEDARYVNILGLSLLGTITTSLGCFCRKANEGCKFRLLLVAPDSHAVNTAMGSVEHTKSRIPDVLRDTKYSLERLEPLLATGNAEVRLTPFAPSFSLLITDPEEPQGKTQVELYLYGVAPSERPHFLLTQSNQPWYKLFTEQFEQLWNEAQPYKVAAPPDPPE